MTIHFCIGIFFFAILTNLSIHTYNRLGAVIFLTILFLLAGPLYISSIKNFIRLILGKPSIILSREYYIDKINGITIKWEDINSISSSKYSHWTFLTFKLHDDTLIFRQIKNPIYNLFVRLESLLTKTTFKTNSSFILGDNDDIYRSVFDYYKSSTPNKKTSH